MPQQEKAKCVKRHRVVHYSKEGRTSQHKLERRSTHTNRQSRKECHLIKRLERLGVNTPQVGGERPGSDLGEASSQHHDEDVAPRGEAGEEAGGEESRARSDEGI